MVTTLAGSPAGPIEPVPLKKRQLHRYWRLINGEWIQTHPLPADPVNRASYLAKGFRLNPPGEDPAEIQAAVEKKGLMDEITRLKKEKEDLLNGSPLQEDTEKEALYSEIAELRKEREEMKKAVKTAA